MHQELATLLNRNRNRLASAKHTPEISVIVPTLNERDNVTELVRRLDRTLANFSWEVVFVDDDSRDGTLSVLRDLSRADPRVRLLQRIGRRGLASAVTEGILSTSTPIVAVMDCDLQHDETLLPAMIRRLLGSDCELVVASRYMNSGSVGNWAKQRVLLSRAATRLALFVLPVKVSDPMSGFFAVKRDGFDLAVRNLSNHGYKILLDILLSASPRLRVAEIPYQFRPRVHGESKLDSVVLLEYAMLLFDKATRHMLPARFLMFMLVGGLGFIVHIAVLACLKLSLGISFAIAQSIATIMAMMFNFFLNNLLTYRDLRLRGFGPLVRGLVSFSLICSIGAISNVGIASVLFQQKYGWWLAGIGGVLVGVVWNYAMTSMFTWKRAYTR
jgi:dolichol-phosphate mannosyltransferase